ncbi:UDP-N-acetylmuramoyl-L-alanine--D-glutamate ligase [Kineosporia sp. NBRC 101731]|uniref:UDP-N-acetylmuramoyl-L-alanine--D-glutamate ligase n=1 Tax=Kineosporia sp. NBRC 101731 TaxID=3032199 RepID=UPI0024A38365|nr:UDP-N-acetylmuramoyl-L-alanine--D-glutamate ligase [Kineosporia sp. NBRC 101731]GLY27341.1 UDP-N-acetylmuramoylalanine--D-glutamate ligase [Kineosporia sp. NBRC 101731]
MSDALSWDDLAGARIGIYGLGREGEASLRACQARGIEPLLVDDNPPTGDIEGRKVLATAEGGAQALAVCEIVIKSPGISRYAENVTSLINQGVQVVGGLGLWVQGADPEKVVLITGTKGKSTTASITGHLLKGLGYRTLVGGNIGVPPFDPALDPAVGGPDQDFWVIEVSSYQATDILTVPHVVGVTSLNPDHLPWHGNDLETYYRDKLSLAGRPGARWTVANGDSTEIRERSGLLGPQVEWVTAQDAAQSWIDELGLLGVHNRRNAAIARVLLQKLGVPAADDEAALRRAATGFAGLESRLQQVGMIDQVGFVDDGLSTNVLPTLAAVEAFDGRRVALIVGGQDRGIDYRPLAEGLRGRDTEVLVLTTPDNGPRIAAELNQTGSGPNVTVKETADLDEAVEEGYAWARPNGVVLLSPAAPSFGRFRDYRHRGEAFVEAMNRISRRG